MSVENHSEYLEYTPTSEKIVELDPQFCSTLYGILRDKHREDLLNYLKSTTPQRIMYLQIMLHEKGNIPYKGQEGIGMNCKTDQPDNSFGEATKNALMRKRKEIFNFLKGLGLSIKLPETSTTIGTKEIPENFETIAKTINNPYNTLETTSFGLYLILDQHLPAFLVDRIKGPLQKSEVENLGEDNVLLVTLFQNGLSIKKKGGNSVLFSCNFYRLLSENQRYLKEYLVSGLPLDKFDSCIKEYTCNNIQEPFIEFSAKLITQLNITGLYASGSKYKVANYMKTPTKLKEKCATTMRYNIAANNADLVSFKSLADNEFIVLNNDRLKHAGKELQLRPNSADPSSLEASIRIRGKVYTISQKNGHYTMFSHATGISYSLLHEQRKNILRVLPQGHARDIFQDPNYFSCGMTKIPIEKSNIKKSYLMVIAQASEIMKRTGGNAIPIYFQHRANTYKPRAGSRYYSGFHAATLFCTMNSDGQLQRYIQDPTFASNLGRIKPLDAYLNHMKTKTEFKHLGMLNTSYTLFSGKSSENLALNYTPKTSNIS